MSKVIEITLPNFSNFENKIRELEDRFGISNNPLDEGTGQVVIWPRSKDNFGPLIQYLKEQLIPFKVFDLVVSTKKENIMKLGNAIKERLEEKLRDENISDKEYTEMAKMVEDSEDKKALLTISNEKKKHFQSLRNLYQKLYPDENFEEVLKIQKAEPKAEDKKMLESSKRKSSYEPGDVLETKKVGPYIITLEEIRFYEEGSSGPLQFTVVIWKGDSGTHPFPKRNNIGAAFEDFQSLISVHDVEEALKPKLGELKKTYTAEEISEKHGVSLEQIQKAFEIGDKIELEHTKDPEEAHAIASHHLWELADYYDKKEGLPAMEKKLEGEEKTASRDDISLSNIFE